MMAGILRCVLIITVRTLRFHHVYSSTILGTHLTIIGRCKRSSTSRKLGRSRNIRRRRRRQHPDDLPPLPPHHAKDGRHLDVQQQRLNGPIRWRPRVVHATQRPQERQQEQIRPPTLPLHSHRLRQQRTHCRDGRNDQGRHQHHHRNGRRHLQRLIRP